MTSLSVTDTSEKPQRGWLFWPAALLVALVLVAGMTLLWSLARGNGQSAFTAVERTGFGAQDYAAEVARIDDRVARGEARVARASGDWLNHASLAAALSERAQLTGSHADLVAAQDAAARGLELAPAGSGPIFLNAALEMDVHRNARAAEMIDRTDGFAVEPGVEERAAMTAMRGDLAFYSGDYPRARELYLTAQEADPGAGTLVRLANWHQHMGDFDRAQEVFARALAQEKELSPRLANTILLFRGGVELKRGKWDEAERYFREADRVFPGHWLTQAHLAQMDAVAGRLDAAARKYRIILEQHDDPSVMSAYASVLDAQGKTAAAERWTDRGAAIYRERSVRQPEAYYDHLLDQALNAGDVAEARRLANGNYRNRSYGDAAVGVARSLLAAGEAEKAMAMLDRVEASGWRSSEQYVTRANVCEAMGDLSCRRRAERRARAINPYAFDARTDLLAFGKH